AIRILREEIGQDLDRDVAPERGVGGAPHDPHPALADLLDEPVLAEDAAGAQLHAGSGVRMAHTVQRSPAPALEWKGFMRRRRMLPGRSMSCKQAVPGPFLD